ncbi:redox-regulated ATPase YchF [Candidatus Persebacteraceae bacterium Df01]|jgi:hypothetical protein|uniref:Ribosome-binding ATPase YchF n=1 Tax=Candidatus Doriopsillibacter californiensis TaxID=2970740 RepID=A0ABT7QNK1_9GAMM|nr:redox-regulated ATPase YchF [Candidatus Persebacteraceae bacterium Df01]
MGLKCGIVGLPNVGKSTLFNALTAGEAAAANYPFCTIEPNVGIAELADERLQQLAVTAKAQKTIPAVVEFVDIAGLVEGAAQNAGLGNRFLAHIREADGIAHVVRCFESDDITHVSGDVKPTDDISAINTELALADLDTVEKIRQKAVKNARLGDKDAAAMSVLCDRFVKHLDSGSMARTLTLNETEALLAQSLFLLTAKPIIYVANVNEDGFENNPRLQAVEELAQAEGASVIPICAQLEADTAGLSEDEKTELLQDYGLQKTALARLAQTAFDMLGLATYFTAGVKEARAWTIRRGMTAPEAAGVIHTDFMRGFIRAEVCGWEDFVNLNGEVGARAAGKMRLEGKEYVVQDGDVMNFRFNV